MGKILSMSDSELSDLIAAEEIKIAEVESKVNSYVQRMRKEYSALTADAKNADREYIEGEVKKLREKNEALQAEKKGAKEDAKEKGFYYMKSVAKKRGLDLKPVKPRTAGAAAVPSLTAANY